MEKFSAYAFNKSHAVAYSINSIRTGWLCYYYPYEYMTAVLNSFSDNAERLQQYLYICGQKHLKILPPSLNKSDYGFTTDGKAIQIGLGTLKNVKSSAYDVIKERAEAGQFKSMRDFIYRMVKYRGLTKNVINSFAYCGLFDSYKVSRKSIILNMGTIMKYVQTVKELNSSAYSIFDAYDRMYKTTGKKEREALVLPITDKGEFNRFYKLIMEQSYSGMFISGHPMDDFVEVVRKRKDVVPIIHILNTLSGVNEMVEDEGVDSDESNQQVALSDEAKTLLSKDVMLAGLLSEVETKYSKKGNLYYLLTIQDRTGTIHGRYFPRMDDLHPDTNVEYLNVNEPVLLKVRLQQNDFGLQFTLRQARSLHSQKTAIDASNHNLFIGVQGIPPTEDGSPDFKMIKDAIADAQPGSQQIVVTNTDGSETLLKDKVRITPGLYNTVSQFVGRQYAILK